MLVRKCSRVLQQWRGEEGGADGKLGLDAGQVVVLAGPPACYPCLVRRQTWNASWGRGEQGNAVEGGSSLQLRSSHGAGRQRRPFCLVLCPQQGSSLPLSAAPCSLQALSHRRDGAPGPGLGARSLSRGRWGVQAGLIPEHTALARFIAKRPSGVSSFIQD